MVEDDASKALDEQLGIIFDGGKPDFDIIADIEDNWNHIGSQKMRQIQKQIAKFALEEV